MPRLKMLTVPEAAEILNTSPWTARQLLRRGDLRGTKYGNGPKAKWRVSEAEIERYITRQTIITAA